MDKEESYLQNAWSRLRTNRPALFSLWTLAILFALAIAGPWISPYSYSEIHLELKNTPPSAQFWFGSDELGRDIFTRIWWGAYLGTPDELLVAGTVGEEGPRIAELRAAARESHGWIMDVYLLRSAPAVP